MPDYRDSILRHEKEVNRKEMMVQKIKKCDLSEKENRFSDPSYWDA